MNNSLRNLSVYNPGAQTSEALKRGFIVRLDVLAALLAALRSETPQSCAKHQLLIGQRGMGKTTLLYRLALAIREDEFLSKVWLPLNFQEEQFNVTDLSVFWRNCFDALIDAAEAEGLPVAEFDAAQQRLSNKDADATLAAFMQAATKLKRRPLLLVDNLDMVFARISNPQAWALRATLQEPGAPMIIGAATQPLEQHYDHSQAFYDFLQVRWLDQLDFTETRELLMRLAQDHGLSTLQAELTRNPARLVPLHLFSGGNLRTLMLLFKVLADGVNHDVQKDIEDLLDACTPLYKSRIEALPAQQQAVFVAVALAFDPISAADLDQQLQLGINVVSAQLNKLVHSGVLRKAPTGDSKRLRFEVTERFFGIWYLMRANRRDRSRMQWLARFLRDWYSSDSAALNLSAEALLAQASDSSGVHAALLTADGVPGARSVRRAALARLSATERKDYAWADIPKLIKPLSEAMQIKMEKEFSVRTLGYYDWAVPIFRERKANLALIQTWSQAEDNFNLLLKDPEQCLKILDAQVESGARECGRGRVLSEFPDRLDEAESAFRRATSLDAKCAIFWSYLGWFLKDWMQAFEESESVFQIAVSVDETCADAWAGIGNILLSDKKRLADAEIAYLNAIRIDDTNARPWNDLGVLLKRLGRFQESKAAYENALRLNALEPVYWTNLGTLLTDSLKDFDGAEKAYRSAISCDVTQAIGWAGLAYLLSQHSQRFDEAHAAFSHALAINDTLSNSWNGLGALLSKINKPEEAEGAYRKSIKLEKSYVIPWINLVRLWFRFPNCIVTQTYGSLLELFELAVSAEGIPEALEPLIALLVQANKLPETLNALEQTELKMRAQPLLEALRALHLQAPTHLASLAAEVRETSYQVLKRLAPEFAARIRREMPAMVAGFVLPDSV